jgi:two-component system sensor histidine kinase KdpD
MRSTLLSAVSHDLRTPLAVITGAATALRDDRARILDGQYVELIGTICDEAERLGRLVANLLDMTRLESGGLHVKREWVPLEELVGAALTRLEDKLVGRPVTTDVAAGLPLASVDPVLMGQVLVNLIENAIKYTPAGSPLELRAGANGKALMLEVLDRGPGIPSGSEEKVFEKFHRGTHVGVGGVGLGLPICRGIVEAHGGTIRAENREGGGAMFRVTLPRVGEAPSLPAEQERAT